MLMCTVCGEWSPCAGGDRLDICDACYTKNFSGAMPPLDLYAAGARAALEAYVDSSVQMTRRQLDVLRRAVTRSTLTLEDHHD